MKPGTYRHFKGNDYILLGLVKHSETQEELVLYRPRESDQLWVRPLAMWNELVDRDGYRGPRFRFLEEEKKDKGENDPAD